MKHTSPNRPANIRSILCHFPVRQSARLLAICLLTFWIVAGSPSFASPSPASPELWLYYSTNLQVDDNLRELEPVFRRAAAAGYRKVFLNDSKFSHPDNQPKRYFENIEKVRELAAHLGLEIVPGIFPVGYSNSMLFNDPALVESLRAKDGLWVVNHGEARPVTGPETRFPAFEDRTQWDICDPTVAFEDAAAHVSHAAGKNARVAKRLRVEPFQQYHVSVLVRTKGYNAKPMLIQAIGSEGERELNYTYLPVKPTQDWKLCHMVFNSLENTEVMISFRAGYEGAPGELWWRDPKIEAAGFLNLVRRRSEPLVVKTEDGRELREGEDFEPVRDPKMGTDPWAGEYGVWHEPPVMKTRLPDGTRLRVSFSHAITIHSGQAMICPSESKTVDLLREQARRMEEIFHAKAYFMNHDEIRVLGRDEACAARNLDAGALLADNVRTCQKILRETSPGAKIYVWSDMFDPHANARDHYYLVKGNLAGSWDGLDPSVIIANWNSGKPAESLAWFADRGHRQILAGYYDEAPEKILEWLKVAGGIRGIDGVMYTTWENNYADLERFAGIVRKGWKPGSAP